MKQCPKCSKTYDDSWGICLNDSISLVVFGEQNQKRGAKPNPDTKECPFCREAVKIGASVCPHCKKEIGASVIIQGIGALITLPILIFLGWLSIGLFYNLNGLRSDANGQEFRHRAEGFNKTLDKIETAFLKLTSNSRDAHLLGSEAKPTQYAVLLDTYSKDVRLRVRNTVASIGNQFGTAKGGVSVDFVLNPRGGLEKVIASPIGTQENPELVNRAIKCVQRSAPFEKFPPGLGSENIPFTMSLYFD